MDLALSLGGMTVGEMTARMSTGEAAEWMQYAGRRALPWRRMEMYLAQIAQVTAGGRLSDWMLRTEADDAPAAVPVDDAAVALSAMAGGIRIRRRKKPKQAVEQTVAQPIGRAPDGGLRPVNGAGPGVVVP